MTRKTKARGLGVWIQNFGARQVHAHTEVRAGLQWLHAAREGRQAGRGQKLERADRQADSTAERGIMAPCRG